MLINYTGWTGWDPIASLAIAVLIFASVLPLVIDTGKLLCLNVDESKEAQIRMALAEVSLYPLFLVETKKLMHPLPCRSLRSKASRHTAPLAFGPKTRAR